MDARERQLALELESDAAAQAARLQELLNQALSGDTTLPRAAKFISSAYSEVRAHIEAQQQQKARGRSAKFANWLRAMDPGVAAVASLREVINTCAGIRTEPVTVQVLASKIGRLFELEIRMAEAERVNPLYMQKIHEQVRERGTTSTKHLAGVYRNAYKQIMKEYAEEPLSTSEHIQIGKFGLQAVIDAGLAYMVKAQNSRGKLMYFELHDDVLEYLTSYEQRDVQWLRDPHSMLMQCPPDPWDGLRGGGYLSPRRKLTCPLMTDRRIRQSEKSRLNAAFTPERMPKVFDCANYLQSIPFQLHKPTVDAILSLWQSGGSAMGMPSKVQPAKPEFPLPEDWSSANATPQETEVFFRWKRDMTRYYESLKKWRGKVRELTAFLKSGKGHTESPAWCPVFMDTRNRWYYRSVLNPQGSDMSKAALHFHEKKPLGKRGLFWLKVAIASHHGVDQPRFKKRAEWVDRNWDRIQSALDAPGDYPDVWGTDAPWCMFSAAWELREALRSPSPEEYCTGLPVHMDATCSGLQHFCAMLRDVNGGMYVNLYDSDSTGEGPKLDIYSKVSANSLAWIKEVASTLEGVEREYAKFWLDRGCPRAMSKKPVMTYVYGATLLGIQSHCEGVAEELWGKDVWGDLNSYRCTLFLAKALFRGVEATVPAAAECMRWLQAVTRRCKGRRMEWTSLTGFLVQHDYQDYDEERIKLNSCGIVQTVNRVFNGKIKPVQMANAISPNFVHNLDSTHLTLTALRLKALGLSMVAIHDSFGTHPCDVDAMHRELREAFYEMYQNTDLLANLAFENDVAEVPPVRGDLDLSLVLNSEFFFC